MAFQLRSAAFDHNESIPTKYTCDGDNVSPPLSWEGFPEDTKSFALICEDPDAPSGTFSHWVLYNLAPGTVHLLERLPTDERVSEGAMQGKNNFGKIGYGGPCPPPGNLHHYHFYLYALDAMLDIEPGASREQIREQIQSHILDQAELIGLYSRK